MKQIKGRDRMSKTKIIRVHLEAMRDEMQDAHLDYYVEHINFILSIMEGR